jgi:enamine deaminase RidA (YjgF/YER057c/UK114 family)
MPSDRKAIWGDEPKPLMPYSPAIKAGGWVFFAGQLASDFKTGLAPEAGGDGRNPNVDNQLELQSRFVLENLKKTADAAGIDIGKDLVRIYQWFTSPYPTMDEFASGNTWPRISITPYLDTRDEFISEPRPASTGMGIRETGLLVKDTIIEVDMIGMDPEVIPGPSKGTAVPEGTPSPLAGYSPAIQRGDWVFLAGEIPVDWVGDWGRAEYYGTPSGVALKARANPNFWYDSDVERQTAYTLEKQAAIAEAAGTSLDRAVKATVYIGHPSEFEAMDRAWRRWFPESPPARVVIPYMGLGGRGSRVEIAFKLLSGTSDLSIETIEAEGVPPGLGHEPQAVKAGNFLFFSTVAPFDHYGSLEESTQRHPNFPFYGQPPKLEMRYMLDKAAKICDAAGTSFDQICRRQAFHDDFTYFAQSIEEWAAHFDGDKPASTTLQIGGPLLVPGSHVLLDLIAYCPD